MKKCIPKNTVETLKQKLLKGEISPNDIAKMLPEDQKALKAILEEIVAENLGVKVSSKEIKVITAKAKKIDQIQKKLGNNFGDVINHYEDNLKFLEAKKDMDIALKRLSPSKTLKVFSGTVARGSMLTSVKSPILNIGSNTVNAVLEAFTRRLSRLQIRGGNNKIALDYVKKVNKIYQKTGFDISRALGDDLGLSGERVLGEMVSAEGKGLIRKTGRFFEDITFKQLMGAPDVAFSSVHFADSVNLASLKIAKGNKKIATEIMVDAMSLEPKTDAGKLLKAQGILDAQMATYTNKSAISKASEGLRKIINDLSPDIRIGDWVMPFVKTPANVISLSIDYAGLGAVKGIYKMGKMIVNKSLTKQGVQEAVTDMVRSGIGYAGALMIANQIDEQDFVGAYDPARQQIESLRNSNYNSVRIGDKWISLDWFGPLGVPLAGILYAKKYGADSKTGETLAYSKGAGRQLLQIPGFDVINDVYDSLSKKDKQIDTSKLSEGLIKFSYDNIFSRLIPSIIGDVSKAIDKYEREATTVGQKLKSKIPGLRSDLPIKKNIFGEEVIGEPAWSDIIFGARVKTSKETETIKKIKELTDITGKNLSLTDWNKTTGKQLNEIKAKIGVEEYNKLRDEYGKELKKAIEELMASNKYNKENDTAKINMINSLDEKIIKKVLSSKGIKYK